MFFVNSFECRLINVCHRTLYYFRLHPTEPPILDTPVSSVSSGLPGSDPEEGSEVRDVP